MDKKDLTPKKWILVKVGEIYNIVGGGTPSTNNPEYWNGNIPWITSADIFGLHDIRPRKTISKIGIENSATNLVPEGSIIVVTRVSLGRLALSKKPICFSQDSQALLGNKELINPEYSLYFLSKAVEIFKFKNRGTTISGVTKNQLSELLFSLPPINEQKRIVENIEELFSKLDAGVAALEKVKAQVKRYRQAILKAAFSGQLTADWCKKHSGDVGAGSSRPAESYGRKSQNDTTPGGATTSPLQNAGMPDLPAGWEWNSGKDVFNLITSGSRGWAKYYSDIGPIFLRMGNLDHNSISLDLSNIKHVQPPKLTEGVRTKVKAGDILISITADVGMIALIPKNFDEAYINQHIALCRPYKEIFPKYVAWYLVCQEGGLRQFQNMKRGATKIGLGLDDIRLMNIPLTKEEEQIQIVSEIEHRFSVADEVEKTIENALKQAQRLRQSILKWAFEGKLVPQDPNDEPAEKLLERIKSEKIKLAETKKSRKKK